MKYSKELTDLMNKVDMLKQQEEAVYRENEKKLEQEKEKIQAESKKQLVKKIEAADVKVSEALHNLESVKKEVKKILDESNARMKKMLDEANQKVKDAKKERYNAVAEYNKNYGVYTVYVDDAKATKEFLNTIDSMWDPIPFSFWF